MALHPTDPAIGPPNALNQARMAIGKTNQLFAD